MISTPTKKGQDIITVLSELEQNIREQRLIAFLEDREKNQEFMTSEEFDLWFKQDMQEWEDKLDA